jgi:hypothetical protein
LTLEEAELVSAGELGGSPPIAGRAIHPALVSGTLTVEKAIEGTAKCDGNANPPPTPINVRFLLDDASGQPGGDISVPFSIRADRASQGSSYSIQFDEAILEDTGDVLPPGGDVRVLEFDFHIGGRAPAGNTLLEFVDGGQGSGGPVSNKLIAGGDNITPQSASLL